VVDLANAHVAALNYLQQQNRKAMFEIFNIGTGTGNSVLEVIQSFEKVSGTKLPYQFGPRRPGDVVQIYASCDKAKNILGWQATRNLDNCTHTAWQWEQKLAQQ
jgi:UDP-glucose 4-epimerase